MSSKILTPLNVRTYLHSCASDASPVSPPKFVLTLSWLRRSEDCRRSISGPLPIRTSFPKPCAYLLTRGR
uniref:Uncharacterized protein n=1 Tax=Arundo donax TaxID=35708 RepID=A0A0A9FVD5_ARUDO